MPWIGLVCYSFLTGNLWMCIFYILFTQLEKKHNCFCDSTVSHSWTVKTFELVHVNETDDDKLIYLNFFYGGS